MDKDIKIKGNDSVASSMIEELYVENFKRIRRLHLKLPGISMFIGPNGSGKSSAIQVLALLKQSLRQGALILNGDIIRLGDWKDVVFGGNTGEEILFSIVGNMSKLSSARFTYTLKFREGNVVTTKISADLSGMGVALINEEWEAGKPQQPGSYEVGSLGSVGLYAQPGIGFPIVLSSSSQRAQTLKDSQEFQRKQVIIGQGFNEALASEISSVVFVGPFRGITEPGYPLTDQPVTEFFAGKAPEEPPSRLMSTLGYRRDIERAVGKMTKELFGTEVASSLTPPKRTSLVADHDTFDVNIVNEGSGLNQSMFILGQLAVAPKGSMLAIEEPEIHLHPAMQRKLMDLLIRKASEAGKRLIFTTHSEHILLSAITKVIRGELPASDFGLYQFSIVDGEVKAQETSIRPDGTLDPPLKEFFEVNVQELSDLLKSVAGERE